MMWCCLYTTTSSLNALCTALYRTALHCTASICYVGGQGVGYFDKDPLVNKGDAALREYEGVEVSEDNVSAECYAVLYYDLRCVLCLTEIDIL